MSLKEPRFEGYIGWMGALGRVIAFIGLLLLFALGLGYLYARLPIPSTGTSMLLGGAVQAVAALLAGVILISGVDRRSPKALGIGVSQETPLLSVIGVLIGVLGIVVATALLLVTGKVNYDAQTGSVLQWAGTLGMHAAVFAIAAFAEEAVFRGYAFQVLVRSAGAPIAIVLSSAAFTWAHGSNPGVGALALANIFFAGVVLAVAYLRTYSLWFATAVHLGWNWAMAALFDLPVSGIEEFDTPLYEPAVSGPTWLTGGAFGPEGGLIGTLGLAIALIAVLRFRRVRPDPGVVAAEPLALIEGKLG